ncbi:MAG: FAD binding domain-containing protein [Anaerolineaceae bacterium]|nr:FAD binding domain-containing protein [Anaerolineaceae bacterium]
MQTETTAVQTSQEVSALLGVPNSFILAGGTTFSPEDSEGIHFVDISGIEGLDGIKQKGTRIEIGPLATLDSLGRSGLVKKYLPALAEAASMASPGVRDRGTLGGNLGGSPAGDLAAALMSSGAKLTVKTEVDFRELLIDRFWDPDGRNVLQYDEWISRVSVQISAEPFCGSVFGKSGEWKKDAVPTAAAVRMSLDNKNNISSVRSGLRPGASYVRRMFPLEKALKNRPATEENFRKAAEAVIPSIRGVMEEKEFTVFLMDILCRCRDMAAERRIP